MMSLLVGHFLTSRLFDSPADDAVLVANLVALMGWPESVADTAKASNQ